MKKLLLFMILPMLSLSQDSDCGERPIKPIQSENQTKTDYKKSTEYINYKADLKIWKSCMSPRAIAEKYEIKAEENYDCGDKPKKPKQLSSQTSADYKQSEQYLNYKANLKTWKKCISPMGMSEKDEEKIKKSNEIIVAKFLEKVTNPCGKKPEKPARPKGVTHDEFKQTTIFKEYKKLLKEWKRCNSPQGISKRNQTTMDKDFEKIQNDILKSCGEKPEKPTRPKDLNHEEYKQTKEWLQYREALNAWKECSTMIKNMAAWGDCGEKPKKPFRKEGMDHEEYKQTQQYAEYRNALTNWKECIEENKK